MSTNMLKFIKDEMSSLDINYQFGTWATDPVPDPYFVGDYSEVASSLKEENGYQETTFMLTGTGTSWLALEEARETIENNFAKVTVLDDGSGIAVFYAGANVIPTGDANYKRIQINLQVKEWRI